MLHTDAQERYRFLLGLLRERLSPPASVVELGAAPGDQIAALADAGYDATAVDIGISSDGWADGTEGRMVRLFEDHGVNYVEWDLEQTPYPLKDDAYDAVVFTEVFEHLREYPVSSLEEVARVLKPGGYLFFTTPNAASLMKRLKLLRGRTVHTPMHDWIGGVPHARHAREYLWPEIHLALGIAGLEVDFEISRHFHLDDPSMPRRVAKLGLDRVAQVRKTLGPQIVIVARKPTPNPGQA